MSGKEKKFFVEVECEGHFFDENEKAFILNATYTGSYSFTFNSIPADNNDFTYSLPQVDDYDYAMREATLLFFNSVAPKYKESSKYTPPYDLDGKPSYLTKTKVQMTSININPEPEWTCSPCTCLNGKCGCDFEPSASCVITCTCSSDAQSKECYVNGTVIGCNCCP